MSSRSKIEVIIPLASRRVVKDWPQTCRLLQSTLTSVLALPHEFASVSLIGHEQPEDLPLGGRCRWTSVDWEPPRQDDIVGKMNDKGLKVRLGVQKAFERGVPWVMFMDADDLVSNRLSAMCDLENHDAICFENGYRWEVGADCLQRLPHFHQVCGTSWVIRVTPSLFPVWLSGGTHRICDQGHSQLYAALVKENARIQTIIAPMAIYCVGHVNNTSNHELQSSSKGPGFLPLVKKTKECAKRILRRKPLTTDLRNEFSIPFP